MRFGRAGRPWRSGLGGQKGAALLLTLTAIALAGAAAAVVTDSWSTQIQREKEDELLRIGDLYAKAIASYYASSPGSVKRYPPDLPSLLEDRRFVVMTRHLRALYADPVSGSTDWGIVSAPEGGVMGVFSKSEKAPWRRVDIRLEHTMLTAARQYSDWKFVPAGAK